MDSTYHSLCVRSNVMLLQVPSLGFGGRHRALNGVNRASFGKRRRLKNYGIRVCPFPKAFQNVFSREAYCRVELKGSMNGVFVP